MAILMDAVTQEANLAIMEKLGIIGVMWVQCREVGGETTVEKIKLR